MIRRQGNQEIRTGWEEFAAWSREHFTDLRKTGGEGLYILSEPTSSLTVESMRRRFEETFPRVN